MSDGPCRIHRYSHALAGDKCSGVRSVTVTPPVTSDVTITVTPCSLCAAKDRKIAALERQLAAAVGLYAHGPTPKTSAERVRAYRARQKAHV